MTLANVPTPFTPDDLLNLESEGLFELVDGKLVKKQMSSVASETAGIAFARLFNFLEKSGGGIPYPEQTFQCFPHDPSLVRRPDVAFVTADRLAQVAPEGHITIAPDLAVEVVSPTDKIYELDEKLADYRAAGVKLVWVINPNSRVLKIHRINHTYEELKETDTLSGESILPGFSVLVRDMLPKVKRA
jgi:Uma2 family endonuclease